MWCCRLAASRLHPRARGGRANLVLHAYSADDESSDGHVSRQPAKRGADQRRLHPSKSRVSGAAAQSGGASILSFKPRCVRFVRKESRRPTRPFSHPAAFWIHHGPESSSANAIPHQPAPKNACDRRRQRPPVFWARSPEDEHKPGSGRIGLFLFAALPDPRQPPTPAETAQFCGVRSSGNRRNAAHWKPLESRALDSAPEDCSGLTCSAECPTSPAVRSLLGEPESLEEFREAARHKHYERERLIAPRAVNTAARGPRWRLLAAPRPAPENKAKNVATTPPRAPMICARYSTGVACIRHVVGRPHPCACRAGTRMSRGSAPVRRFGASPVSRAPNLPPEREVSKRRYCEPEI